MSIRQLIGWLIVGTIIIGAIIAIILTSGWVVLFHFIGILSVILAISALLCFALDLIEDDNL